MADTFVLGHSSAAAEQPGWAVLQVAGIQLQQLHSAEAPLPCQLVLLDDALLDVAPLTQWQQTGAGLLSFCALPGVLPLPVQASADELRALLGFAVEQLGLQQITAELAGALHKKDADLRQLVDVGLALSAERDLDCLLEKILEEGRRLSHCDAASLFLIERRVGEAEQLLFKLTQNASLNTSQFQSQRLPLSKASIVGYVALTSEELNLPNVYALAADAPYRFNRSFDLQMGYRTESLLAIPMLNHRQEVVGVLEFINRHSEAQAGEPLQCLPFSEDVAASLRALASQAAVAIENRQLLDDISRLFDGFVQASVFAIEQRDPTTSGHSFRVAELCLALAGQLANAPQAHLRQQRFSAQALRELRYAALLHDFGKVGVREHVLTKARKLNDTVLENLHYRVALAKENLTNHCLRRMLAACRSQGGLSDEQRALMELELAQECTRLDNYLARIVAANEPTMLSEGDFADLREVQSELVKAPDNRLISLLDEGEFCALAVRKGSLTPEEREEIERHVVHTRDFLNLIPWTPDLQAVPKIAAAHHEKLNGSGYPYGLSGDDIPCASRIMTICDIFDALTAADRPYKPAMPVERALDVLQSEVKSGLLDQDLVQVFIDSRCFLPAVASSPHQAPPFSHHVCDYEPSCNHDSHHQGKST